MDKKQDQNSHKIRPLEYSPKILLAWSEAIAGNGKIRDWLIKNGFRELGLFAFALRNNDEARNWLMENGYPHLVAMINGVEGNEVALKWLLRNNLPIMGEMAKAGDGDAEALKWLLQNGYREFALIAKKIQIVKDEIERDNNDFHKISRD